MGSCFGASLEVLERSTGTSISGFNCLAGRGLLCATEGWPKEGLRMLSMEKASGLTVEGEEEERME